MGEHGIKLESKTLLDTDYVKDLSVRDEKWFQEVLGAQGVRIGLKINVERTLLLRLGVSEVEEGIFGHKIGHKWIAYLTSVKSLVKMVEAVKI